MLNYVKTLHDECVSLALRLKFNKILEADGLVVCLYGRLIELTGGMLVLIVAQQKASASIVFRSFLEAYVDLINLTQDCNYHNNLLAAHHQKWVRILNTSNDPNPYLREISELRNVDEIKAYHRASLDALKRDGYAPMRVLERFQKANMEDEYRSIYSLGSSDIHNDFGALSKHHIVADGDDFQLVFYKEGGDDYFFVELDSVAGLLLNATLRIHNRLKSGCDGEIQKLDEELGLVRARSPEGNREN